MTWFNDVLTFHKKVVQPIGEGFDPNVLRRRLKLIHEEYEEVLDAMGALATYNISRDVTKSVSKTQQLHKELCAELIDLIYVTLGTFVELGIDPQPVWDAIQYANMQKQRGTDGGKAVKGAGWQKPEFELRSFGQLPEVIADFDPNRVGTPFRDAPPAETLEDAIGRLSDNRENSRFQVGRAEPIRRSKMCKPDCSICKTLDEMREDGG